MNAGRAMTCWSMAMMNRAQESIRQRRDTPNSRGKVASRFLHKTNLRSGVEELAPELVNPAQSMTNRAENIANFSRKLPRCSSDLIPRRKSKVERRRGNDQLALESRRP